MNYDNDWPDQTRELQKAAARKTIRHATMEELMKLGEARFPVVSDPWCERYFTFLKKHRNAKFYRAEIGSAIEVVYCRDPGAGIWFMPGFGMGFLRERGLEAFAEIVDRM